MMKHRLFYRYNDVQDNLDLKVFDHYGDWICVDFDIDLSNHQHPKFTKAIFHNHGRQLFVDDPDLHLAFVDGPDKGGRHPSVWIEDGTHEAWPVSGGGDGFNDEDHIPTWVWTDNKMDLDDIKKQFDSPVFKDLIARIIEAAQDPEENVCRSHDGKKRVNVQRIVDVGKRNSVLSSPEVRTFHEFKGKWGAQPDGYGDPPASPPHQTQMWSREGFPNGGNVDVRGKMRP